MFTRTFEMSFAKRLVVWNKYAMNQWGLDCSNESWYEKSIYLILISECLMVKQQSRGLKQCECEWQTLPSNLRFPKTRTTWRSFAERKVNVKPHALCQARTLKRRKDRLSCVLPCDGLAIGRRNGSDELQAERLPRQSTLENPQRVKVSMSANKPPTTRPTTDNKNKIKTDIRDAKMWTITLVRLACTYFFRIFSTDQRGKAKSTGSLSRGQMGSSFAELVANSRSRTEFRLPWFKKSSLPFSKVSHVETLVLKSPAEAIEPVRGLFKVHDLRPRRMFEARIQNSHR